MKANRHLSLLLVSAVVLALLNLGFGTYILVSTPTGVPVAQRPSLVDAFSIVGGFEFVAVGFLVARRQPRNLIGWLLLGVGIVLPLAATSYYAIDAKYAPAAFPDAGFITVFGNLLFQPVLGAVILSFLVFPDGRVLSRRWLPLVGLGVVGVLLGMAGAIIDPRTVGPGTTPLSALPLAQVLAGIGWLGLLLAGLSGVVSLFLRYRRGSTEVKHQLRWIFIAVFATVASLVVATVFDVFAIPVVILSIVLPATIGLAVLKYRLYGIDVVISRTVVYGALALLIAAVYIGLVVGIGSIVGRGTGANLILSLAATAIVALAFQPARARLQRAANRLVYGARATPYEVLSDFSERLSEAYASEELLPRMAQVLGEGTGAERAEVWLRVEHELRRVAIWPAYDLTAASHISVTSQALPTLNAGRVVAVRHQGELLGALTITKRSGESLTPIEAKLLDDLANQAGLMLRNVGLTEALMEKVIELRASRQRLVAAQDQERRRLERNLHDGAQQHLVALRVNLGLARRFAVADPEKATSLLTQMESDTDEAIETLRDLARGIYPPLLADRGLVVALQAQGRRATVDVRVVADGVARYPQEVEAAVYYCCLEALQNVQKYANARRADIRLGQIDGALSFTVTDDGEGFDPTTGAHGSGIQNMRDRLDALGGAISVTTAPGRGTTVSGNIPVPAPRSTGAPVPV